MTEQNQMGPYENALRDEAMRALIRHMEKALDKMQEHSIESEGRLAHMETALEQLTANMKTATENISDIKSKNSTAETQVATLANQMGIIKWFSGAVGLAIIGIVIETLYFLFKAI